MILRTLNRKRTFAALDRALSEALELPWHNPPGERVIVFSDWHKGDRRGNDDLQHNETVLLYALEHYLGKNFRLILAGDIEEGWECRWADMASAYRDTLYEMERLFHQSMEHGCVRLVGNHDAALADPAFASRYLTPLVGAIPVYSALRLGERLVVLHGHQGEWFSDRFAARTRFLIHSLWAPLQRLLSIQFEGTARNVRMQNSRDFLLAEWAAARGLILIAGHTHRAVFESRNELQFLMDFRHRMLSRPDNAFFRRFILPRVERMITDLEKRFSSPPPPTPAIYFNAGCGVYDNGVTGIEIEDGIIRLVKWESSDSGTDDGDLAENYFHIVRKVFQSTPLNRLPGFAAESP